MLNPNYKDIVIIFWGGGHLVKTSAQKEMISLASNYLRSAGRYERIIPLLWYRPPSPVAYLQLA